MTDSLAGFVLAAGSGTRLFPLTAERPKALCPVGGRPLVDLAVDRLAAVCTEVAVNARPGPLADHLVGGVAHVSVEPRLLGTGGALGRARGWIDGRAVLLANADAVHDVPLSVLVDGWEGSAVRALLAAPEGAAFGPGARVCAVLMPWEAVRTLPAEYCSVYDEVWRPWLASGALESVTAPSAAWFDCGNAASYLAANLWASGGTTVVGPGAVVDGVAVESVVWDGARVRSGERLERAIRTTEGRTVLVR